MSRLTVEESDRQGGAEDQVEVRMAGQVLLRGPRGTINATSPGGPDQPGQEPGAGEGPLQVRHQDTQTYRGWGNTRGNSGRFSDTNKNGIYHHSSE